MTPETNQNTVGGRLKSLIEEWGLTDHRLAQAIGKSSSTIHRIVKNESSPTSATVKAIVEYFKVKEKWFLTGLGDRDVTQTEQPRDTNIKNVVGSSSIIEYDGNKFMSIGANRYLMLVPYVSGNHQDRYILMTKEEKYEFHDNAPYHPVPTKDLWVGDYVAYEVLGDAMVITDTTRLLHSDAHSIGKGSIITCKCINQALWNKSYIFKQNELYAYTSEEGIFLRKVIAHDIMNGTITVRAYNAAYEDQIVKLDTLEYMMCVVDVNWQIR